MGWSKGLAEWREGNTVYLSVVFSWCLPDAFQRAAFHRAAGFDVRAGGPAVWSQRRYLQPVATEIGGEVEALTHHNPQATIASRGCPVGCHFCIVPAMEGKKFTLIPDFVPRPILCDNNLSALPVEYQEYIIERYVRSGVELLDANSGFEPATFDRGTLDRWRKILRGPWRFALDESKELEAVRGMMGLLSSFPPRLKRVYVLIGNEPIDACVERVTKVIAWGGEPYCQPLLPFNATERDNYKILYDWTAQKLADMARWANRYLWRKTPWHEYAGYRRSVPNNETAALGFR